MSYNFPSLSTLLNKPSFMKGVARTFDVFGTIDAYDAKRTEAEADAAALQRDWKMVGYDLFTILMSYVAKQKSDKNNS